MDKATPRPWTLGAHSSTGPTTPASGGPVCGGRDWPYVTLNRGEETIVVVPAQAAQRIVGRHSSPLQGSAEAQAALILRAVNLHDELVAALSGLTVWIEESFPTHDWPNGLMNAAHAVLAKAKGERG